jgi:selenocysteine lyase/cysteine desulfurase
LTESLRDRLTPAGFEFLSPTEEKNRCGIVTFRHLQIGSERFADALAKEDIVVSLRYDRANRGWLRVSPHFYNSQAEMQRIADLLMAEIRP